MTLLCAQRNNDFTQFMKSFHEVNYTQNCFGKASNELTFQLTYNKITHHRENKFTSTQLVVRGGERRKRLQILLSGIAGKAGSSYLIKH